MHERTVAARGARMRTCRYPAGCNRPASGKGAARGLCATHYQRAHQLIRENKTTMAELEKTGMVLRKRPTAEEVFLGINK